MNTPRALSWKLGYATMGFNFAELTRVLNALKDSGYLTALTTIGEIKIKHQRRKEVNNGDRFPLDQSQEQQEETQTLERGW